MAKKEKQPIVFIHVPKTGGSSLHQFLNDGLAGHRFSPARFYPELNRTPASSLGDYDVFSGHYGLSDFKRLEKISSPRYFTVMRDPVERVISLYFYWKAQADTYQGTAESDPFNAGVVRAIQTDSIEEFLETDNAAVLATISNTHCRFITSSPKHHVGIGDYFPHYLYSTAVRALQTKYSWYGTMEDLNENPQVLWESLGVSAPKSLRIPYLNRTPAEQRRNHVSEIARSKILELNRADMRLYQFVLNNPVGTEQLTPSFVGFTGLQTFLR